jgi:hypothetical protein
VATGQRSSEGRQRGQDVGGLADEAARLAAAGEAWAAEHGLDLDAAVRRAEHVLVSVVIAARTALRDPLPRPAPRVEDRR